MCVLTLNRPEKRNAMNPTLGEEVTDALERLRNDDRCRVLVITGAGESFCAGMDLKQFFMELQDKPAEYDRAHRVAVEWRGRTLRLFPKPTIAMVNGHCFGGAFTIVEGCDLAVAAADAKMGLSEINFKMFPGGSVGKSMGNLLRPRDYMLYALTGRPMSGQIAADIGFINYAVPREELRDKGGDILIMARTDANGTDGMDEALRRCEMFRKVGVDITFLEAPKNEEEMRRYGQEVDGPKMANMVEQGTTPYLSPQELEEIGYKVAIYPAALLMSAIKGMQDTLEMIKGGKQDLSNRITFQELQAIVGFPEYYDAEKQYAAE